jgi:hypothetical protein
MTHNETAFARLVGKPTAVEAAALRAVMAACPLASRDGFSCWLRRCDASDSAIDWRGVGTRVAVAGSMTRLFGATYGLALCALPGAAFAQSATPVVSPEATAAFAPVLVPSPVGAPDAAPVAARPSVRVVPPRRDTGSQGEGGWYGWQTLASDAAASGLFFAAAKSGDGNLDDGAGTTLSLLSAAVYLAGAPTVHLLHHRSLRALGSFGLRIALPVVGGMLGSATATCPPPTGDYGNCGTGELVLGAGVGFVLAIALDAGALAWDEPKRKEPSSAQWGLVPTISSDGKRGEVRVFGTF